MDRLRKVLAIAFYGIGLLFAVIGIGLSALVCGLYEIGDGLTNGE